MNKTWLVTGTSSGLGRILTEEVLKNGDSVFATLRNLDTLQELKEKHGDSLHLLELDVTHMEEVRSRVDEPFSAAGRIDVLFSNADGESWLIHLTGDFGRRVVSVEP